MKTSLLIGSALCGVALLWAAPTLAQDTNVVVQPPAPAPPPSSTVVVNNPPSTDTGSPRLYPGLIWGGLTLWGVAYTPAVVTAAVANDACSASTSLCVNGRGVLYVPIVGPFIAIPAVNGTGSSTAKTLLALDGAFQTGGIGMMITGIVLSSQSPKRHAAALAPRSERKLEISPFPIITASTAGLGLEGRF